MSIVVTGATGHLGRLVIADLLERGVAPGDDRRGRPRRRPRPPTSPRRAWSCAVADYDRPDTLDGVFAAGDRVLLISGNEVGRRIPQHQAVIDAATAARAWRCWRTPSVLGGPDADFALADEHRPPRS